MPGETILDVQDGENLLQALSRAGLIIDAPCGGNCTCGKCAVLFDGQRISACQMAIDPEVVDAVAAALDAGFLNERGKILCDKRFISITDRVYLTQRDIRQVQVTKGAIADGKIVVVGNAAQEGAKRVACSRGKLVRFQQIFRGSKFWSLQLWMGLLSVLPEI